MAEEFLKNYPPVKPPSKDAPSSKNQKKLVEDDTPTRKILFLGDDGVGKTTFIRRYCEYTRDYCRCDTYRGTFLTFTQYLHYRDRGDKRIPVRILDLPAGLTEESRRDQYPNYVNLVVLCFAVDDPNSLDHVSQVWLPEFRRYLPETTRFYLLGLKCDMRLEMEAAGRVPVSEERGRRIHERYEFSGSYMECSVEGNPERARYFMDILISDTFIYDAPGFRRVESPE